MHQPDQSHAHTILLDYATHCANRNFDGIKLLGIELTGTNLKRVVYVLCGFGFTIYRYRSLIPG